MITSRNNQRGAVSIFMVVFSALFVTIITISFVGVMLRGAQQAADNDLSNSAYDAALAGVEDAKRLILKYRQCLRTNDAAYPGECSAIRALFLDPKCNMVKRAMTGDTSDSEMLIQSSNAGDDKSKTLDQAYTCVIANYLADEKKVEIGDGESELIPIDANGIGFNTVTISWFTKDPTSPPNISIPMGGSNQLPTKSAWMNVGPNTTRPPILRAQWIQHSGTFNVSDFDSDKSGASQGFQTVANTKTVFLYPNTAGNSSIALNDFDDRPDTNPGVKSPVPIICNAPSYTNAGGYACSVNLSVPTPIDNTGTRTAYLRLGALYNKTKVRIALKNGADTVKIVAPGIDSTGRANDLFRRVRVGVSFTGDYPSAGFDIGGNLCKDFAVTNNGIDYDRGNCDPDNP